MKHLYQSTSVCCGQTCVAMVANVSMKKVFEVFGKQGKTYPRDVVGALRKLGYRCASKLKRTHAKRSMPELCIAHVKVNKDFDRYELNKRWGHWVVVYKGKVYDPGGGINPQWEKGVVIASYLTVYGKRRSGV